MIAKSDLIILVVSAGALAVGIYRWQQNVTQPPLATANVRVVVGEPADVPANAGEPAVERNAVATVAPADGADARPLVRRLPAETRDPDGATPAAADPRAVGATAALPAAGGEPPPDTTTTASTARDGGGADALYGVYRVRSGDYLGLIAERFGTSVDTLRSINGIEGSTILVDQELRYPLPAN